MSLDVKTKYVYKKMYSRYAYQSPQTILHDICLLR